MKTALCMLLVAVVSTSGMVWYRLPIGDPYSGVLVVTSDSGQGSCTIVAKHDGFWYALTARHVAEMADRIKVDGYWAEVVQKHVQVDLALIRFQSPEVYRIYEFAETQSGEAVVLVGWYEIVRLMYYGYVITTNWDGQIATNTGVFPGCSGGAVFNNAKQVIGITVSMGMVVGRLLDSTAFCVPGYYGAAMVPSGD